MLKGIRFDQKKVQEVRLKVFRVLEVLVVLFVLVVAAMMYGAATIAVNSPDVISPDPLTWEEGVVTESPLP